MKINAYHMKCILMFALLQLFFSAYYGYLNVGGFWWNHREAIVFWGGITIEDSTDLLYVILYFIPQFLLITFVINDYIKEMKSNFIFIFLRTPNRMHWLYQMHMKLIFSIVLFELIWHIIPWCYGYYEGIWNETAYLLLLASVSNLLYFFLPDSVSVLGTILAIITPVFLIGVIYENRGPWQVLIDRLPCYWGNWNYFRHSEMTMGFALCAMLLLYVVVFLVQMWKFKKYEFV